MFGLMYFQTYTLFIDLFGENLLSFLVKLVSFQRIFKIIHKIIYNQIEVITFVIQSKSDAPNNIGFSIDFSGFPPVFIYCISCFNFSFSYTIFAIFWFMIALLLDFRIDKSLTLFLYDVICSYSYFLMSTYSTNCFYNSLFFYPIFFLIVSYYFSLSWSFCISTWYFVNFSPFFYKLDLTFVYNSLFYISHDFFLS